MKSFLLSLISTFISISIFAQPNAESANHLAFKGVPIDGTLNEFVGKMKNSGFTHIGTENGTAVLQGDFAAYKNCIIRVSTLKQKDLVSNISVEFPNCSTWSSLSSNYFNLKGLLTEKYGSPAGVVERFDSPYNPDDDNDKMYELGQNRCKYYSTYTLQKGSIQLSIQNKRSSRGFVMLTYSDKINSDVIREKALGDL